MIGRALSRKLIIVCFFVFHWSSTKMQPNFYNNAKAKIQDGPHSADERPFSVAFVAFAYE